MSSIPNMPIWVQFFETLRELPELWKIKSEIYRDRNKKKIAWEKLLDVYIQIEPNANIDSLKKRLTNIRTCYRRELKKIQQGEKSGAGAEDEYVPNLWYFTALDFLSDQEIQVAGTSTIDIEVEHEINEPEINESADTSFTITPHSLLQKRKKKGQQDMLMAERNSILKEALNKMNNEKKDEASIFAESWALSYRKLSPTQQLFAKKAIDDILILGQLQLLNMNTVNTSSTSSTAQSSGPPTPQYSQNPSRSSTPFFLNHRSTLSSQLENTQVLQIQTENPNNYTSYTELLSDSTYSCD